MGGAAAASLAGLCVGRERVAELRRGCPPRDCAAVNVLQCSQAAEDAAEREGGSAVVQQGLMNFLRWDLSVADVLQLVK